MKTATDYHCVFMSSPWFASMPEQLQHTLLANAHIKHLAEGQMLHAKGDEGTGFYGVCEGRMRVVNHCSDGRTLLLAILDAGTWFGEISMFDDQPRTHDSYGENNTVIAFIPKAKFRALLASHPEFYPFFTKLLCTRVRSAFQFINAHTGLSIEEQLKKRLLMLVTSYGQHMCKSESITLSLSQESLAQMINSSRQTVNQLLKGMEKNGEVKLTYGKITIIEPNAFFGQVQ